MMNKKLVLIGSSILLMSTFAQADDIDIKDETTQQTRTQLQDRIQSMSDEERAPYKSMNENREKNGTKNRYGQGNGSGKMNRYGQGNDNGSGNMNRYGQGNDNGSGNMNRYERGNSDGGYGSGYGSRQGGGGGKGRGH